MLNMRRLLALFLLVLLPLQFSWASVAAYCQHEAGSQAQHFGHHDHQHQDVDKQDKTEGKLPGGVDYDCSACHAGCAVALNSAVPALISAYTSDVVDGYWFTIASPPVSEPERPNWVALA
mgnify:CR=1 FL=1